MSFLNPFRRSSDRSREATDRARDRAFDLGEQARREAEDAQRRQAEDDRELEESILREIESAEFPPEALSEAEAWARSGEWHDVSSSNVAAIQYDEEDQRLVISYKDGSIYAYSPVSPEMAISMYEAPSHGTWVWDRLRERGTSFGYKVPYTLLSGPSQRTLGVEARGWMRNAETRRKHGQIPPSGRDYLGNPFRPRDVR